MTRRLSMLLTLLGLLGLVLAACGSSENEPAAGATTDAIVTVYASPT